MPPREPVTVFLTPSGEHIARRVSQAVGGALHGRRPAGKIDGEIESVSSHLRGLFAGGYPIIGICASGILIRALAPLIADKTKEAPVLAVAEDGSSVIPLLGGHRGANALALQIAEMLGGHAALTTAGEVSLGVALDAPPAGWRLENPSAAKAAVAGLLAGAPAKLRGHQPWLDPLTSLDNVRVSEGDERAPVVLSVEGTEPMIYRRQTLIVGVGCARGCPPDELIALVNTTLADHGRSQFEVAGVYWADVKTDEAAIHALGRALDVPVGFYSAAALEARKDRLANPSATVFAEVGCHGVAEGAALAGAGARAVLSIEKHKSANATCAACDIAGESERSARRGRLSVVGIGPGQADWRTPEASRLIAEADDLVGYGLYIDLLGGAASGKSRHDFPLGGEEVRCRFALERAGEGRNVALVCSGDAGIYAMGALVMELLARGAAAGGVSAAARRVEIVNAPGISALQAASARAGAMIGHDFCAVSLSDLLTPRNVIIQRIEAAAMGDFVIAFYNPLSKRRRDLLTKARNILLKHRPPETPVVLATSLGRPDETLRRRTLADLQPEEVDMLTVVLIGSSESRAFRSGDIDAGIGGWHLYTPRGYATKIDEGSAR